MSIGIQFCHCDQSQINKLPLFFIEMDRKRRLNNSDDLSAVQVIRLSRRIAPIAGGQEQHVTELADAQSRQGLLNMVLNYEGEKEPGRHFINYRMSRLMGARSDLVAGIQFGIHSSWYIRRIVKQSVIVHSHGTYSDLFGLLALPKEMIKARFHTFHGGLGLRRHEIKMLQNVLPKIHGIFVVNELIRKQLEECVVRLPPIYVASSAVSDCFFSVKPMSLRNRLVLAGRLTPVKAFDTGLHVAARLQQNGYIAGVDIAGDGPESQRLERIASALGVKVRFHGYVDKQSLATLFAEAAVLLVPSRTLAAQAEGSPTVIMEAWAAGVPVVATCSGGIPYLVRNGEDGFLAREDDVDGLYHATLNAITETEALADAGKRRVTDWTWDGLARQIIQIYNRRICA